jgi:hypothetical protein
MEIHGRQFVAGPHDVERPGLGGRAAFASLVIRFNERVPVTTAGNDDVEIALIGHVLDPLRPGRTNAEIVSGLTGSTTFRALEDALSGLAGRWAVFVRIGAELRLYPDAAGSKSLFHSGPWVASQPGLLGCTPSAALDAFPGATNWPVGVTPFPGVRQLTPNHYLDLRDQGETRFAPGSIRSVGLDEAAATIAELLQGTIHAVVRRGSVALPVTAGFDSRALLSAARPWWPDIDMFTVIDSDTPRHDRLVPRRLSRIVGRPIREIGADGQDSVVQNTCGLWRDPNESRLAAFGQAQFVLLGHVSEVLRCFYWKDGHPREVTPALLSGLAGFRGALESDFAAWLDSSPDDTDVDPLDLFYWESRAGIWSSLCCTALDGYCDVISPFNCRRLLETGLGVPARFRCAPYELHRLLCRPELRGIPFNSTFLERVDAHLPQWLPWRVRNRLRRLIGVR